MLRQVCCVNVVVDTRVSVYLGSNYYNKVEGLCGNYNGKSSDDFGADTSVASSLVDQASVWKTTSACPEGEMELIEEHCKVRFSGHVGTLPACACLRSIHCMNSAPRSRIGAPNHAACI